MLLPRYSSLEMFIAGDPGSMERRETFERYRCAQPFHAAGPSPMAEPCSSLLHSLSAILHDGALREYSPVSPPTSYASSRALPCQALTLLSAGSLPLRPPGLTQRRVPAPGWAVPVQTQCHGTALPPLLPRNLRLRAQRVPR